MLLCMWGQWSPGTAFEETIRGGPEPAAKRLRTCLLKSLPFFSMKFAPAGSLLDAGPGAPRRTAAKRGADGKDRVPYVLLCRRRALTAQSGRLWSWPFFADFWELRRAIPRHGRRSRRAAGHPSKRLPSVSTVFLFSPCRTGKRFPKLDVANRSASGEGISVCTTKVLGEIFLKNQGFSPIQNTVFSELRPAIPGEEGEQWIIESTSS